MEVIKFRKIAWLEADNRRQGEGKPSSINRMDHCKKRQDVCASVLSVHPTSSKDLMVADKHKIAEMLCGEGLMGGLGWSESLQPAELMAQHVEGGWVGMKWAGGQNTDSGWWRKNLMGWIWRLEPNEWILIKEIKKVVEFYDFFMIYWI